MRILGVNVKADVAYLAVAEDGGILSLEPGVLKLPTGVEESRRLIVFQDEVSRLLENFSISKVCVLEPETNYSATYKAFLTRITIETVIMAAAAGYGARRLSRARCRSLLDLPKSGTLKNHVSSITAPVGPAWTDKRDLAALAALACEKDG